ncbi:MAG: DUF2497 domain-containing protein [Hyphomicrobiales bacterium]|nr:DUF2497 domain-containing protein [Hyphomicrobiales bacterium]
MEEILASIRRIISDEEEETQVQSAPAPDDEMSEEDLDALFNEAAVEETPDFADDFDSLADMETAAEEDVLELTDELAIEDEVEGFGKAHIVEPQSDLDFMEPLPEPEPEPEPEPIWEPEPEPEPEELSKPQPQPQLLSPTTDAAVSSAFQNLAHTILSDNARTLEDLVKEMLRPMLKTWLDDNLPAMVERMVRAEIERVSRGGGRR